MPTRAFDRRFCAALLVACLVGGTAAVGQQGPDTVAAAADPGTDDPGEPQRVSKQGKVLRAFRLTTPPLLDGRLTDEAWQFAPVSTGYVQRDPDNGQAMTQQTRVQIAYDDRFLYVAIACVDDSPAAIATGMGRRDESPPTDQVSVAFDPRHDHQTAYLFQTNPSGWQGDFAFYDDDRQDRDYNAVWDVRTEVTGSGWTAELRIPFSQMRFTASPQPGQVWGFNGQRQIRRLSEAGTWVPKPRGQRGEVSFFGHVVFDAPIDPPRRLELTPYALARSERRGGRASDGGAAAGLDVRFGVGTGSTLSATINPDFGQVEQDPAVLNLSVFETFFPEKRAFFLEDSRTFVPPYSVFQLFHSRRIGRVPGRLPTEIGDTVLERPDETTILGAAKLTGKSAGWTYGALTALTGPEHARVETSLGRLERLIEPTTSFNVARLQRDVRGGTSNVGVLVTGVFRDRSEDAFTGGFDYNLRWDQNRTRWDGHWVVTRAPGLGGTKTSGGGLSNISLTRTHWNVNAHVDHFGRDFRVNDIGFFRTRANRNNVNVGAEVGTPNPWLIFRRFWTGANLDQSWTDERLVFGRSGETYVAVQFRNFWNVNGGMGGSFQTLDDLDTRGGPPIVRPAERYAFYNVNSDSRKSWRAHVGGSRWSTAAGGTNDRITIGLSLQPSDRLQASVDANYNTGADAAQWIVNRDTDGDDATDYVYGTLARDVLSLTFRGTYAINRDLTVQGYLQPFVAVGHYDNIRRLARPRSFEFEPVTIPFNPDFNTKSVRGNVIIRWEYVRGSTFFFVWDLSQADASRPGQFSAVRDLRSAFGANANHVLLAKVSYWLNR